MISHKASKCLKQKESLAYYFSDRKIWKIPKPGPHFRSSQDVIIKQENLNKYKLYLSTIDHHTIHLTAADKIKMTAKGENSRETQTGRWAGNRY